MMRPLARGFIAALFWTVVCGSGAVDVGLPTAQADHKGPPAGDVDRSPVDLVLTPDEAWILTANQTSNTVSLIDAADGRIAAEVPCGRRPSAIALSPDGSRAVVSATYDGRLDLFALDDGSLRATGSVSLGFEPRGIAISPDGDLAYVALTAANEVAVVSLDTRQVEARIPVGRWPRYLALSPDGSRLAVAASGDGGVWVVDTVRREVLFDSRFMGLNIGHMAVSSDGKHVYFPWMVYADRPITPGNIREGWVLGNRLARVRLDESSRREALALDPRGQAVGDPHGIALSPDESHVALAASGTHELVVLRLEGLPLRDDGPGDHLPPYVASDDDQFFRIPLGGRPMGIRYDRSGEHVFVANYLDNSVQVVNVDERRLERTIALGGADEPSLARRGEAIFLDAQRSADGWYSCHSCHYEGGPNAVTMDTNNDESYGTYKMVLSLHNVAETGPWFWHGLKDDLHAALKKSLIETMRGPEPTDDDVEAVAAYLRTLIRPENSRRQSDGGLSEQAARGQRVFQSESAACATCHSGPYLTDGEVHDVGLASSYDVHDRFNTPSLLGVANRAGYLHHGRAKSLEELLVDLHSPDRVSGSRPLTDAEVADLVAYLESL